MIDISDDDDTLDERDPEASGRMIALLRAQRRRLYEYRAYDVERFAYLVAKSEPEIAEHPLVYVMVARDWVKRLEGLDEHDHREALLREARREIVKAVKQHPWRTAPPPAEPALTRAQAVTWARLLVACL